MTDQPEGIVHGSVEELERPPELPPHGPKVWIRENLLAGDTRGAQTFNGLLTFVFALLGLNVIQFIPSYIFDPERRWSAVTYNMKFMMVQAFPQADLVRIWISIGIFFVLVALSLVAWDIGGRMNLFSLAKGLRGAGAFLMLLTVMHGASGASKLIDLPAFSIDSPGDWSSPRLLIFVIGAVLFGGALLYLRRVGTAAKNQSIPFLSVLVVAMAAIALVIWTVELPVVEGQFGETVAPIATTTTWPWTILFILTVAFYFLGRLLIRLVDPALFKRLLVFLWLFSYPVIIMIIQRNPILHWGDLLGGGPTPFFESALGLFLVFSIVGGALIWWLALPDNLAIGRGIAVVLAVVMGAVGWVMGEAATWTAVVATAAGAALIAAAYAVQDRVELARIIGSVLAIGGLLVWFVPMPFVLRILMISLALVAVVAPSFGGSAPTRLRMTLIWVAVALLVVAGFELGAAETALEFGGTTFLGGFNLSILLAITGVVLSFPLGVVLALARTSTMPIFRLIATGYIELIRSVPLITWLFFGSVMLALFLPAGVEFDEIVRIIAVVVIFSAAYVAESVRGGLQSIGTGQYEAARAMGLSTVQSTSLIILPQAVRAVLPALVGSVIVSFKDTSLVAIIGLFDVLLIARSVIPNQSDPSFKGTQPQMVFFIAIFYWVFTFTFSRLALRYEKSIGLGEH